MIALNDAVRSAAAAFCDMEVPEERLRAFLRHGIDRFSREFGGACTAELRADIDGAIAAAREIGLLDGASIAPPSRETPGSQPGNSLALWGTGTPARSVAVGELAPRPLAKAIDEVAVLGEAAFTTPGGVESLLRQAEVRRLSTAALAAGRANQEPARLLVADVSTFLARFARVNADVRTLNAALKINDREFTVHRALPARLSTARYLLAIAEQEQAAVELLS